MHTQIKHIDTYIKELIHAIYVPVFAPPSSRSLPRSRERLWTKALFGHRTLETLAWMRPVIKGEVSALAQTSLDLATTKTWFERFVGGELFCHLFWLFSK